MNVLSSGPWWHSTNKSYKLVDCITGFQVGFTAFMWWWKPPWLNHMCCCELLIDLTFMMPTLSSVAWSWTWSICSTWTQHSEAHQESASILFKILQIRQCVILLFECCIGMLSNVSPYNRAVSWLLRLLCTFFINHRTLVTQIIIRTALPTDHSPSEGTRRAPKMNDCHKCKY